jgi:hypothetical protein
MDIGIYHLVLYFVTCRTVAGPSLFTLMYSHVVRLMSF